MTNEEIIAEFITFNEPILNEIRGEDEELSAAVSEVVKELFAKYTGIDVGSADKKADNQYKVGDMVETLSGKWDGLAEVKKAKYDPAQIGWVYEVEKDGKRLFDLEENIFVADSDDGDGGDKDYASMSVEELQKELEVQKELLEIFDDPEEEENIKANDEILAIEVELDKRQ